MKLSSSRHCSKFMTRQLAESHERASPRVAAAMTGDYEILFSTTLAG